MTTQKIDLKKVRLNENNPRTMSEAKGEKLMNSILVFPQMMEIRPIVLDEQNIALGGNMRATVLKSIAKMSLDDLYNKLYDAPDFAAKEEHEKEKIKLFWQEWHKKPYAYAISADNLTEDEKRQFIIKDNVGFGTWDWDKLANEWDNSKLLDWGLDVWQSEGGLEDIDNFFEEAEQEKKEKDIVVSLHIPQEEADAEEEIRSIVKEALSAFPNVSIK